MHVTPALWIEQNRISVYSSFFSIVSKHLSIALESSDVSVKLRSFKIQKLYIAGKLLKFATSGVSMYVQ